MRKKSFEIAIVAMFVALIAVLQVSPLYIPTSWGMRIDLVAVPVLIAYFLFGLRTSLAVSVGMFVSLSFVAAE
jgi:riboflavin transporter FmnP